MSLTQIAVPIREADATVWLPNQEIQRLLASGWAKTNGPAREVLDAIDAAVTSARTEPLIVSPAHEIGGGEPGWKAQFQRAFNELAQRGTWLGDPQTDVHADGPGVVQYFQVPTSPFGWVLCALPNSSPVAVAGEVWQALQTAGSGARDGNALAAVGFPAPDRDTTRLVDNQAVEVTLAGGHWGAGRLLRGSNGQQWRWEPLPAAGSPIMLASARNWTGGPTVPQLRVRALAALSWGDTDGLEINPTRRTAVEQSLRAGRLAEFMTVLSARRGNASLLAGDWTVGSYGNALDRLNYVSAIAAPDGRTALSAEVMMTLPPAAMTSTVVTCAELRLDDVTAWSEALASEGAVRGELRLSLHEIVDFFVVAWQAATEMLPQAAADDPLWLRWADTPPPASSCESAPRTSATRNDRHRCTTSSISPRSGKPIAATSPRWRSPSRRHRSSSPISAGD